MRRLTGACLLCLGTLAPAPAAAQIAPPGPPGPYVIDLRLGTSAIPQAAVFFPPVPSATIVPSRGYGFEIGAHVYLMRLGPGRLGVGASVLRVRGASSPAVPISPPTPAGTPRPATPPGPATTPDVDATLTTLAPQVSFNFGSAEGWSYVSAGVGRVRLTTGSSAFGGARDGTGATPARSVESAGSSLNVGGGARWFAKAHLAFSFELRVHLVSAAAESGTSPATPRATLLTASAGISLR